MGLHQPRTQAWDWAVTWAAAKKQSPSSPHCRSSWQRRRTVFSVEHSFCAHVCSDLPVSWPVSWTCTGVAKHCFYTLQSHELPNKDLPKAIVALGAVACVGAGWEPASE